MLFGKALLLIEKYGKCPDCGNDKFGKNHGNLIIEDKIFVRECKCGFKITVEAESEK